MKQAIQRMTVLTIALCIMTFTVFSQNVIKNPEGAKIVDVEMHIDHMYLYPRMGFEKAILTVSKPDGEVVTYEFESWDTPKIELDNGKMDMFPNGIYTYTLQVIPEVINRVRSDEDANRVIQKKSDSNYIDFTGHFTIAEGMFAGIEEIEETASGNTGTQGKDNNYTTEDIQHLDDVIITFSLCVGNDCVNGENFGFDTMRLKENNLRIHFQDTSNSASFPTNDWRIVANDSTNGGASYLAFEDSDTGRYPFKVEAGARNNALYVEADGDIGIGTANPVGDLHIVTGNTPTVRLEQDGSSGFTPQTYDVAANEANFFIRDATNGSTLPFRIAPSAPSNALTIKGDGDVGIGTWDPAGPLHVVGDSNNPNAFVIKDTGYVGYGTDNPETPVHYKGDNNNYFLVENSAGSGVWFWLKNNAVTGDYNTVGIGSTGDDLRFRAGDSEQVRISANGNVGIGVPFPSHRIDIAEGAYCNGTQWVNASSRELKENIETLSAEEASKTLSELAPVKFNYKTDKNDLNVGFIAEDVPELVATVDRKGLSSMDVVAILTKVVQTQQEQIQKLNEKIEQLEKNK